MTPTFKPCLLHETAEIALTEIKRFLEPRLMDEFQLRRVSAPLYLPAGSELIDPRHRGACVHLMAAHREVEIVGGLDLWLRRQLRFYDAAPGFGVFTIMNALRPELPESPAASPHVAAWVWQQTQAKPDEGILAGQAKRLYDLLKATEAKLMEMFPHLHPTLHKNIDIITEDDLEKMLPDRTRERRIYEFLHPGRTERPDDKGAEGRHCAGVFIAHGEGSLLTDGEMWVWNRRICRPLMIADFTLWRADNIGPASAGGNIYRNQLAMQLLHQDSVQPPE